MRRIARLFLALPLTLALVAVDAAAQAGPAVGDPPERAGRLSLLEGEVTLRQAGAADWEDAGANWPVTSGDIVATGADGRAEVRVGSGTLHLDADTELEIVRLADGPLQLRVEHGSVALRVRSDDPDAGMVIETRDGRARIGEPGHYRVDYAQAVTVLTAYDGQIEFESDDSRALVPAGQRAEVWFAGRTEYRWSGAEPDDFFAWSDARERDIDALGIPQYVSPEMTGAEDLAAHGYWQETVDYGPVWYPRYVPADWAPYRSGRWIWVRPWGWTWIDEMPWGFAPFHYGRWVLLRGTWAWVPGRFVARPVYSPALVMWVGTPGWQFSFSSGSRPAVGWFPLGPREVFLPHFHASTRFVERVNITHVTSVTRITEIRRAPQNYRFMYRDRREAVTVVPVDAFRHGRRLEREDWRDVRRWRGNEAPVAVSPPLRFRDDDRRPGSRTAGLDERRRERTERDERMRVERLREAGRSAAPVSPEDARHTRDRGDRDASDAGRLERDRADLRRGLPLSREVLPGTGDRRGEETSRRRPREAAPRGEEFAPHERAIMERERLRREVRDAEAGRREAVPQAVAPAPRERVERQFERRQYPPPERAMDPREQRERRQDHEAFRPPTLPQRARPERELRSEPPQPPVRPSESVPMRRSEPGTGAEARRQDSRREPGRHETLRRGGSMDDDRGR